jgi:hypothetical protein
MPDAAEVATSGKRCLKGKALAVRVALVHLGEQSRPAFTAAACGAKGDRPAAIRSALMNRGHCASCGRNVVAKVV